MMQSVGYLEEVMSRDARPAERQQMPAGALRFLDRMGRLEGELAGIAKRFAESQRAAKAASGRIPVPGHDKGEIVELLQIAQVIENWAGERLVRLHLPGCIPNMMPVPAAFLNENKIKAGWWYVQWADGSDAFVENWDAIQGEKLSDRVMESLSREFRPYAIVGNREDAGEVDARPASVE